MKRKYLASAMTAVAVIAIVLIWRPWLAPGNFNSIEELGYRIDYEFDPETEHVHQNNPDRDGKEYVGIIVQKHYSMQIIGGEVTIKQVPYGPVTKEDRLRITLDGRLWVNGKERMPSS